MTDLGLTPNPVAPDAARPAADAAGPPAGTAMPSDDGDASDRGRATTLVELARVTGLVLVVLVPVHLATLVARDPDAVDRAFLIDRWSSWAWLLADWGLLAVASAHVIVSLTARLAAPGIRPGRIAFLGGLATFTGALFLAASWGMLRLQ